jgi:LysM repeat protein
MNGTSISFANITYTIKPNDTFYLVSTEYFGNLTTYQSVQLVNPTLIPTLLQIGVEVIFPIFCKCPNQTQLQNKVNYLVSYVFQPSDNLSSVASTFGVETQSIVDANGNNIQPFDTIFIPVNQLPQLAQPTVFPSLAPSGKTQRKGLIIGLAVGLGIAGLLLVLVSGVCFFRDGVLKKRRDFERDDQEKQRMQFNGGRKGLKDIEVNLMADVSDCLDKYRVFKIDELKEATDEFGENCLIEGSVFKGSINGETYAIKKMKWNACEELKILQKVRSFSLITVYTPAFTVCLVSNEIVGSGTQLHEPQLFPYFYSSQGFSLYSTIKDELEFIFHKFAIHASDSSSSRAEFWPFPSMINFWS